MAGGAAGGFVTRAYESMLKECSPKKYPDLQKAIQAYLGFILIPSIYIYMCMCLRLDDPRFRVWLEIVYFSWCMKYNTWILGENQILVITAPVEPGMRYWQPSIMRGDVSLRMSSCCSSNALDFGILRNSDFTRGGWNTQMCILVCFAIMCLQWLLLYVLVQFSACWNSKNEGLMWFVLLVYFNYFSFCLRSHSCL